MLKAGIVGLKNSTTYIKILQNIDSYSFVGLYDPSFQIDLHSFRTIDNGVLDFLELVNNCDLVIFPSDDKVFFPLIKEVISRSKTVFLDSFHKFTFDQLNDMVKLSREAGCSIQTLKTQKYHDVFAAYNSENPYPFIINSEINIDKSDCLFKELRTEVNNILSFVKSTLRKVNVNIAATMGQIPDVYTLNFEFNNGSNCRIMVSSLKMPNYSSKRIIGMDAHYELDFTHSKCVFFKAGKREVRHFELNENTFDCLVTKQLDNLYYDLINGHVFRDSLEYEIETYKVLEKVTDKLKHSLAIV